MTAPDETTALLKSEAKKKTRFRLHNLCCSKEIELVKKALDDRTGVLSYNVNRLGRLVDVLHQPSVRSAETICNDLNYQNLGASIVESGGHHEPSEAQCRLDVMQSPTLYISVTMTALFLVALTAQALWPVFAVLAIGLFHLGMKTARRISMGYILPDMVALMFIAAAGAATLGEFIDAAVLLWLFEISKILEIIVLAHARAQVEGCGIHLPKTAILAKTGKPIAVDLISEGMELAVRPGEVVPTDGTVIKGTGSVDEASVTGESMPRQKTVGSDVFGGTILQNGLLEVRATASSDTSMASQIQDMVLDAASSKTAALALVDEFAQKYTLLVLVVALLLVVYPIVVPSARPYWHSYFNTALLLLVLGCPCALVAAGPIINTCGISAGAKNRVLMKNAEALELLSKVSVVAFDKTGTLTDGRFQTVATWKNPEHMSSEIDKMITAVENNSTHPLAAAIVNEHAGCMTEAVQSLGVSLNLPKVTNFKNHEGAGVSGEVNGRKVTVGNRKFIDGPADGLDDFTKEQAGTSIVYAALDGVPVRAYALFDTPRHRAKEALEELRKLEIRSLLLSGDDPKAVKVVADKLGLRDAKGSLLPKHKVDHIVALEKNGEVVCMVGDGINDAPALTSASVGWAMGAGGTALATKSASVVGTGDELCDVTAAISHARFCRKLLVVSITIAVLPKFFLGLLTAFGIWTAPLWVAVLADTMCLVLVILNGLRALRWPPIKVIFDDIRVVD